MEREKKKGIVHTQRNAEKIYRGTEIVRDRNCKRDGAGQRLKKLGLHRILNWPDIRPSYFSGYPVSGRISG